MFRQARKQNSIVTFSLSLSLSLSCLTNISDSEITSRLPDHLVTPFLVNLVNRLSQGQSDARIGQTSNTFCSPLVRGESESCVPTRPLGFCLSASSNYLDRTLFLVPRKFHIQYQVQSVKQLYLSIEQTTIMSYSRG